MVFLQQALCRISQLLLEMYENAQKITHVYVNAFRLKFPPVPRGSPDEKIHICFEKLPLKTLGKVSTFDNKHQAES